MTRRSLFISIALLCVLLSTPLSADAPDTWVDDFEAGLGEWQLVGANAISIVDSRDAMHGKVLELRADGVVVALARRTNDMGPFRIEADFLFPDGGDSYLGVAYNYTRTDARSDFGGIYLKADGSYLRANPFRDGNASRLLYEEYRTPLTGARAIELDRWHRIAAEVDGAVCHLYVEDMETPAMTFDLYEGSDGLAGFSARIVGDPVWIDNVSLRPIERLSWTGEEIPSITYAPERLVRQWDVAGPFSAPNEEVERGHWREWRPFETDRRGAVVSGRVIEYRGTRPVAYFRTVIEADEAHDVVLLTSATEELALFVNGRFEGFIYRDGYVSQGNDWNAWYDFADNPKHKGRSSTIGLTAGRNEIIVRSRAGQFASGGFFARIEKAPSTDSRE